MRLVVRNNLADLVGSVSLQLDGPVNDPTISGRVTATSWHTEFPQRPVRHHEAADRSAAGPQRRPDSEYSG